MAGIERARRRFIGRLGVVSEMMSKRATPRLLNRMERIVNQVELIDSIKAHAASTARLEFFGSTADGKHVLQWRESRNRLVDAIATLKRADVGKAAQIAENIENGRVFDQLRKQTIEQNFRGWLKAAGGKRAA
ncbi:hypothetical protein H0O03_05040 [Candidatus Micrarchaeota archaeon]|nr:hypothetical protein [Candidatus Micrarchaeota archaeon]